MISHNRSYNNFIRVITSLIIVLMLIVPASSITAYADDEPDPAVISAIVVNDTRDMVLFEKEPDKQIYPASTTKVLMALVVAESIENGDYSLDDTFAAYDELYSDIPWDGSTENIQAGEVMTVRDYLHCALLSSANEACNALAVNDSGSTDKFVSKMNEKAEELGCENSHFANPHGIYRDDHYTTARDMYKIFSAVMNDPIAGSICSTLEYIVPETNKSDERELTNTNLLLHSDMPFYYEYALAGKTGFTEEAGTCLVSAAEKDDDRLICIIMGADFIEGEDGRNYPGSFSEARNLYEWCYSEYDDQTIISTGQVIDSLTVNNGKDAESVDIIPEDDLFNYMKRSDAENYVTYEVELKKDELYAPVKAGDKVGEITAVYNGEILGRSKLIAASDVELSIGKLIRGSILVRIIIIIVLLILMVIVRKSMKQGKRKGGRR